MAGFAAIAGEAYALHGYAEALGGISVANEYRVKMDVLTATVQATVNGGPWFPVFGMFGLAGTLQQAYDAGGVVGSGAGNAILSITGPAVTITQTQLNTAALVVNTNGLTSTAPNPAVSITAVANTTVPAAGAHFGLGINIQSAALRHNIFHLRCRNVGAASGGVAYFEWDALTNLVAETNQMVLDGQGNREGANPTPFVVPGAQTFRNLYILTPASAAATTRAIQIDTLQTAGTIMSIGFAGAAGAAPPNVPVTLVGNASGIIVDMSTNVIPGAFEITGIKVSISASISLTTKAILVTDSSYNAVGGGSVGIVLDPPATIGVTHARCGLSVATFVAYTTNDVVIQGEGTNGIIIAETQSIGTGGKSITFDPSHSLLYIQHTPTIIAGAISDATIGIHLVMTPPSSNPVRGQIVTMGAFTSSAGYAATFDWRGTAGTAAGNGVVDIIVGASTVITGPLTFNDFRAAAASLTATAGGGNPITGIRIDLQTNVVPNNNAVNGVKILTSATTRANTAGEGAFVIDSNATLARVLDIDSANTQGTCMSFVSSANLAAAITYLALSGTGAPGANQITGISLTIPASTNASTDGLFITTAQTGGSTGAVVDINMSHITVADGGPRAIRAKRSGIWTASSNQLGDMVRMLEDCQINTGGQTLGLYDCMYASRRTPSTSAGTLDFSGNQLYVQFAPSTGGGTISFNASTPNLVEVVYAPTRTAGVATVGNGNSLTCLDISVIHPALAGGQTSYPVRGITVTMGDNTDPNSWACKLNWNNNLGCGAAGNTGILWIYATTPALASNLIGAVIDLRTAVTPGANLLSGLQIYTAASTSSGTRAIYTEGYQLKGHGIESFLFAQAAATEAQYAVFGRLGDNNDFAGSAALCGNIDTAGDRQKVAAIRLNGIQFFIDTGAPVWNGAYNTSGDVYIDITGAAGAKIFAGIGGAWVAIA